MDDGKRVEPKRLGGSVDRQIIRQWTCNNKDTCTNVDKRKENSDR